MRQSGKHALLRAQQKRFNHAYRIQVIDRAVKVLDCFTFNKPELSIGEVSATTDLYKSTAHRILMALQYNGLVEQNQETAKYRLGIKFFKLGQQAVARLNLRDLARSYLRALMEETGETVHLAILDNDQVVFGKSRVPRLPDALPCGAPHPNLLYLAGKSDVVLSQRSGSKTRYSEPSDTTIHAQHREARRGTPRGAQADPEAQIRGG
jgi:DNA-binding transcriptional ArsR family regulator